MAIHNRSLLLVVALSLAYVTARRDENVDDIYDEFGSFEDEFEKQDEQQVATDEELPELWDASKTYNVVIQFCTN